MKFKITNFQKENGYSPRTSGGEKLGPWYIHTTDTFPLYLHSDGSVLRFAQNNNGEFTGWYATRERARETLRVYKATC